MWLVFIHWVNFYYKVSFFSRLFCWRRVASVVLLNITALVITNTFGATIITGNIVFIVSLFMRLVFVSYSD